MMKSLFLLWAVLSVAVVATAMPEISVQSALGRNLLSKARRIGEDEDNNNNEDNQWYYDWVAGYSVKFQGCHQVKQWNMNADDESDIKIATKRLIRFRLCPSSSCSANKAAGCSKGYGDYVIDMETFMEAYFEAKRKEMEYACEEMLYSCDCEDDDNKDDGFNQEYCEYDCYVNNEMYECIDGNPYEDEDGEQQDDEFNLEDYMQCAQLELPGNDNQDGGRRRRLEGEEEEAAYYLGPYCSEQGGAVHMGLFSDDTCTNFVEDTSFEELMGFQLPYGSKSLVDADCLSCVELQNEENDNNNNQNNADADYVSEQCEMMYINAGKCEGNLPSGMLDEPNYAACNYMEGIKIVRQDGIIDTGSSRPSAVATAFIVIFAMAFAAMAFYVWYLRTRLGVKKNALL